MNSILDWGIDVIIWCQQISPALDTLFKVFTFFGEEMFFLVFIPLIIWCVDCSVGIRMAFLFLFSAYLNDMLKIIVAQPRPFQLSADVKKLVEETTGGLPSGHTQNTTVVWWYLASQFNRRWFWILAFLLIIFVPISRIYLGVHFPTDILGGYLIAIAILLFFLRSERTIVKWIKSLSIPRQMGIAIVIPIIMILLSIRHQNGTIASAATLLGGGIGLVIERRYIQLPNTGSWRTRILRFICGAIVLGFVYFGLKYMFTGLEPYVLYRCIRYTLVGLSVFLFVPMLFVRLKLV